MMGRAILASAAISGIVLPIQLDGRIATDGGWVRNFPFEHAYRNPTSLRSRRSGTWRAIRRRDPAFLERTRERLERFRAVPPVRALLAEVRLAQERSSRGEPAHYGELIVRLMRVAFARNASSRSGSQPSARPPFGSCHRLHEDVTAAALSAALPWRRGRLRAELDARFAAARFPFRHDRHVPALIVRGTAGHASLDPTFRSEAPWPSGAQAGARSSAATTLTDRALASANRDSRRRGRPGSGQAVGPRADEG